MKHEAAVLADQFARHRGDLRAEAIHAVTVTGLSVKKVAETAGIDRRTLTVWLQVHNAEQKGR
jgi:transposase-like protein